MPFAKRDVQARLFAAIIAVGSFIGLIPPFQLALNDGMGVGGAMWHVLRAFTITTNTLIVCVFTAIALRGRTGVPPLLIGGTVLAILLVGIVFNIVLGQMPQLNWWTRLGDSLHHHVAPVIVPLWWLIYAPHGKLPRMAPLIWALYPLGYCVYSLTRAALQPDDPGRFPYFFMNYEKLGWPAVLLNILGIGAGFVLVGWAVVALDRRLGKQA